MSKSPKPKKKSNNPYIIGIRMMDFSDIKEEFGELVEVVKILAPIMEEKGWETLKEEYFQELKRIEEETGEPVTDPNYFGIRYAQRRYSELVDKGLTETKEVRKMLQRKPIARPN